MIYDCIVIGAGASGLFFSGTMERRIKGLILEKTRAAGPKLLMSGNGQCNVTHAGSIKDFVSCYGSNGKKIRSCLYKYNNASLTDFLENNGVNTIVRDDGKIFPMSMDARDILGLLLRKTAENGFDIKLNTPAERIEKAPFGWRISCGEEVFAAKAVVIASGGCSYPSTGSDGSFFDVIRRDLKLDITELKPALSSVQVRDYPYGELAGISFENALVSIWREGKKIVQNAGGLLFTHHDLSGPAVMNISKFASPGDELKISYLKSLRYEQVLSALKECTRNSKVGLAGIISSEFRLPKRFCHILAQKSGPSLKNLSALLTGEAFEISSVSGFNRAMCTGGGVALHQMDMATMEVKSLPSLFVIGEALDIDGITGGYNLQFAYSSARAAGVGVWEGIIA